MFRRISATLSILGLLPSLAAHTVPTIVVEAEFTPQREAVVKVNLDPRLFLSLQPASLPPVPASWWFDQDEAARSKSNQSAAGYLDKHLSFLVGQAPLKVAWTLQPIDSASAFPLGPASAEVHLLAEHRGPLPGAAGDFKVRVGKECSVPVILLNSLAGESDRKPQSLFPGETSRGFALPEPPKSPPAPADHEAGAQDTWLRMVSWLWSAHFQGDHLALAALLGFSLRRRFWKAAGLLVVFHLVDTAAATLVLAGWLPQAPAWMQAAYWAALALTAVHLLLRKDRTPLWSLLAAAGLCHGLNTPHLHLEWGPLFPATLLFSQAGTLLLMELLVLAATVLLIRLMKDRRMKHENAVAA